MAKHPIQKIETDIIFELLSDTYGFALFEKTLVDFKTGMKLTRLENGEESLQREFFSIEFQGLHKNIHMTDKLLVLFIENLIDSYCKINHYAVQDARKEIYMYINQKFIQNGYFALFDDYL